MERNTYSNDEVIKRLSQANPIDETRLPSNSEFADNLLEAIKTIPRPTRQETLVGRFIGKLVEGYKNFRA